MVLLTRLLLVPTAIYVSYLGLVHGWGLEVKSWSAYIGSVFGVILIHFISEAWKD